jgi:hypothetical protein
MIGYRCQAIGHLREAIAELVVVRVEEEAQVCV